jgi:hypothetical protein
LAGFYSFSVPPNSNWLFQTQQRAEEYKVARNKTRAPQTKDHYEFEKAKTIRIQTLGQFKATSHICMEMLCPNSALAKYAVGKVLQENPTMLGTSWHTPYKYKRHDIHQHSDQRARSCTLRVVLKGSSVLQRIFNVFQCLVNVLQHARNATEQLWP